MLPAPRITCHRDNHEANEVRVILFCEVLADDGVERQVDWIVRHWSLLDIDTADVVLFLEAISVQNLMSLLSCRCDLATISQEEKFIRLSVLVSPIAASLFLRILTDEQEVRLPTSQILRLATDCCVHNLSTCDVDLAFSFVCEREDEISPVSWIKMFYHLSKSLATGSHPVTYARTVKCRLEHLRQMWIDDKLCLPDDLSQRDFGRMMASIAKTVRCILAPRGDKVIFHPYTWYSFLAIFDMQYKTAEVCGLQMRVEWNTLPFKLR